MILVDDQAGSSALFPYIVRLTPNVLLTRIEPPFGDMTWMGNGPDGQLRVGVEYKQIDDILQCMLDGRFVAHQLVGMLEHYDRRYLLVEGRIRCDRNTGVMQKQRGNEWRDIQRGGRGFTYRDLNHFYTTIEEQTQTRVVETFDEYASARWLFTKYSWWTNKEWDEHSSLKQFHVPPPPTAALVKPSVVRRVAKELGGLGWERSGAAAAYFKSVRALVNADAKAWLKVDGVGKVIANRIVAEVTEEQK